MPPPPRRPPPSRAPPRPPPPGAPCHPLRPRPPSPASGRRSAMTRVVDCACLGAGRGVEQGGRDGTGRACMPPAALFGWGVGGRRAVGQGQAVEPQRRRVFTMECIVMYWPAPPTWARPRAAQQGFGNGMEGGLARPCAGGALCCCRGVAGISARGRGGDRLLGQAELDIRTCRHMHTYLLSLAGPSPSPSSDGLAHARHQPLADQAHNRQRLHPAAGAAAGLPVCT